MLDKPQYLKKTHNKSPGTRLQHNYTSVFTSTTKRTVCYCTRAARASQNEFAKKKQRKHTNPPPTNLQIKAQKQPSTEQSHDTALRVLKSPKSLWKVSSISLGGLTDQTATVSRVFNYSVRECHPQSASYSSKAHLISLISIAVNQGWQTGTQIRKNYLFGFWGSFGLCHSTQTKFLQLLFHISTKYRAHQYK